MSLSLDPSGVDLLLGVMTIMIFVPPLEGGDLVDGYFLVVDAWRKDCRPKGYS